MDSGLCFCIVVKFLLVKVTLVELGHHIQSFVVGHILLINTVVNMKTISK